MGGAIPNAPGPQKEEAIANHGAGEISSSLFISPFGCQKMDAPAATPATILLLRG
jgi:hypothetical protein